MASRTGSQTNRLSESSLKTSGPKRSEETQRPTLPVITPLEPALIVLKTGDEMTEQPAKSPYGSKTVALFFITYFLHTSLARPLSWSSSLMVSLLEDFDFRNVGRYLLHEKLCRAEDPTGRPSGIVLQGYPKSILTKLQLQWWSDFERRLDAGDIGFQDFLVHDSALLVLQPNLKTPERGLPRYNIKDTDPTSLLDCFEDIRQLSGDSFIDTLVSNLSHGDEEQSAIIFDLIKLSEHLANFRNVQTTIRQDWDQSVEATQQPRASNLRKMTEKGPKLDRQIQQSTERLPLQRSDSSGMPRWAQQMHDDRHRMSTSSTHAARVSGRDRHISMSNETFFSSRTHGSKDTFVTVSEGRRSSGSLSSLPVRPRQRSQKVLIHSSQSPRTDGPFFTLLQSKGLWPPHPNREQNWSGRGQHVEFKQNERQLIKEMLDTSSTLGCTNSAVVDIVKCKRIHLARKTIFCSKRFTKQQAIEEVAHLEKIQHSHIIRVIGTYTIANELSILLYPVAEYNLETFLQELRGHCAGIGFGQGYLLAMKDFFGCLSNAVAFIHSKMTKHMDIKPKNILVRKVYGKSNSYRSPWKVYIADFGIARSYSSIAATETEGPTMFTRKYAAPEVVEQDKRGLQADIFSLGCVFVEIAATIVQISGRSQFVHSSISVPTEHLDEKLASNIYGDSSYHANIPAVQEFIQQLNIGKMLRFFLMFRLRYTHDVIAQMLEPNPTNRPTARVVAAYFGGSNACCQDLPDPLEASPPMMDEEFDHHFKNRDMWVELNSVHRPRSPVNLGGEKSSAYRMSSLSLHSTSNLNY